MLSRIAESLFWIGRYIERSDGTARILDVHLQLLLEDPWIEEDIACRALLSVMGSEAPEDVSLTRQDVLSILAVDRSEPASIAYSLGAARENARRARSHKPLIRIVPAPALAVEQLPAGLVSWLGDATASVRALPAAIASVLP